MGNHGGTAGLASRDVHRRHLEARESVEGARDVLWGILCDMCWHLAANLGPSPGMAVVGHGRARGLHSVLWRVIALLHICSRDTVHG